MKFRVSNERQPKFRNICAASLNKSAVMTIQMRRERESGISEAKNGFMKNSLLCLLSSCCCCCCSRCCCGITHTQMERASSSSAFIFNVSNMMPATWHGVASGSAGIVDDQLDTKCRGEKFVWRAERSFFVVSNDVKKKRTKINRIP